MRALAIWVARARSATACTRTSSEVTRSRPGTGSVRETTSGDEAAGVDGDDGAARHPAEHGVVLLLEARPADQVVGHEGTVTAHLVGADLAEVAQRLGRADAERPGVDAHRA